MRTNTALDGIKVLDLSRVLAGPWATQILGDLGADVLKIESFEGGDDTRQWGPPFLNVKDNETPDAAYFACCNRNKASLTLDFKTKEGQKIALALATKADVLVENFKVGGLKQYGLDYDTLAKHNPRLIYCSITGFGLDGPYAERPGYDFLMQGLGGLMSITGKDEGAPTKVGVAVCDLFTGMNAVTAILAALHYREMTGEGQHIDCALLDNQIAMLANQASNWLNGRQLPTQLGNAHPNIVPYSVYPVHDGHVIINCGNDRQFKHLCDALELGKLYEQPDFANNADRVRNRDAFEALLNKRLSQLTRQETLDRLTQAKVPCGPINNISEVFNDPHVKAREIQVETLREDGTKIETVAFPAKLSKTPAQYHKPPPKLGEGGADALSRWLEKS